MLTAAVLVLLLGICLLVGAGTALLLKAGENRERRIVERTELSPLAEWRPGRRRLAANCVTAYGPGGPLIAPVSGLECAWFSVRLVRTPARGLVAEEPGEDVLLDVVAPLPAALADETGDVLIDPRLLTREPSPRDPTVYEMTMRLVGLSAAEPLPAVVPRELVDDRRGHESLQLWERRLPAGRPAYALGRAGHAGRDAGPAAGTVTLMPARRDGFTVLTTDDRRTVIDRRRGQAASSLALARFLGAAGAVVTAVATVLIILLA